MVLAFVCAATVGFSDGRLVQIPKITGLPAPHPLAISADGRTVVGQFSPGNPFTWRGGEIARFHPSSKPSILDQYAQGVSGDGKTIVGRAGGAYIWTRSKGMRMIGDATTFAYAVSETGNEVACQVDGKTKTKGYLWSPSGKIEFDTFTPTCISGDGKVVAGIQAQHGTVRAFEFRNQVSQELPLEDEFSDSSAFAANKDGSSIVGSVVGDKGTYGALWKDGKFVKLADLGQHTSVAKAVCRDGSFIGGYAGSEAAVWMPNGKGFYLELLLRNAGAKVDGWKFESVDGIARVGKAIFVTGWAHYRGQEAGYWASFRTK